MISPSFNVIPTSRLEAEVEFPYLHEPGHLDVLYEFSIEESENNTPFQVCTNCGAAIIDKCVTVNDQWACAFCNAYNPLLAKPTSTSYTTEIDSTGSESQVANKLVLVVDTNAEDLENFEALKRCIFAGLEKCPASSIGVVLIEGEGNITLQTSNGRIGFSSQEFPSPLKPEKLGANFFTKKIPNHSSLWLSKSEVQDTIQQLTFHNIEIYGQRPIRATGLAFFLASLYCPNQDVPIPVTALIQGPCTVGPGKVVPKSKKHHIRQHHDIDANRTKYYHPARTFYESLATKISVQCLISSLDQVGILEMSSVLSAVSQLDSFGVESAHTLTQKYMQLDSRDQQITVFTSKGLRVDGCYGPVFKLKHSQPSYSDTPCGVSGTNRWRCRTSNPSLAFSFQIETTATKDESYDSTAAFLGIQFQTSFHRNGRKLVKVDTILISTTNQAMTSSRSIAKSFNKETALVCLMKQIAYDQFYRNHIEGLYLQQWRSKIDKLAARHLKTQSRQYQDFIELLYRLKWTTLLQHRNTTPDESALFQHIVLSQHARTCTLLCKPQVTVFTQDKQFEVTHLDEQLLKAREAMCVDFGTLILVRYLENGPSTAAAEQFARDLVARNPLPPRFQMTLVKGSQDRFFVSKLLPQGGLNTEEMSLDQYSAVIRRISQSL